MTLVEIVIKQDPFCMSALKLVKELHLPDCWIGAGCIRNCVWDYLHLQPTDYSLSDVDVIFFDTNQTSVEFEQQQEKILKQFKPNVKWSVKNQERMRVKFNLQYSTSMEAISYWPETATCIAARLNRFDKLEMIAPYGVDDLVNLVLRPSPNISNDVFRNRLIEKQWTERWPLLRIEERKDAY